jgi:predicted RNA-binding Zn-ribbon protein involved in translation (DUF1610 family)
MNIIDKLKAWFEIERDPDPPDVIGPTEWEAYQVCSECEWQGRVEDTGPRRVCPNCGSLAPSVTAGRRWYRWAWKRCEYLSDGYRAQAPKLGTQLKGEPVPEEALSAEEALKGEPW